MSAAVFHTNTEPFFIASAAEVAVEIQRPLPVFSRKISVALTLVIMPCKLLSHVFQDKQTRQKK